MKKGIERRESFKSKRKYGELLENKKAEEGQKTLEIIIGDKTGKTFWKEINKKRKKREEINKRIPVKE